ncbi:MULTISPECIES: hypothetical protein [Halobacterium]|uniref:hypothetical protein n=1 Tax=Halobacterium TaxID=2239 RepID=UPI0018D21565|nr:MULTISPECIES: hypothetical protein [Halobacterium]MCG1004124.1 hypothetical protein [Halobacterium noricense]
MFEEGPISRRQVLAAGAVSMAGLAGCSSLTGDNDNDTALDRIVVRSDTGQTERVELTLVYAPRDLATERPIRGVYEAPASGDKLVVDGFEGNPGFYSLTVSPEGGSASEVVAFNSYGPSVESDTVQFEAVIKQDGGIWLNVNEAGSTISVP